MTEGEAAIPDDHGVVPVGVHDVEQRGQDLPLDLEVQVDVAPDQVVECGRARELDLLRLHVLLHGHEGDVQRGLGVLAVLISDLVVKARQDRIKDVGTVKVAPGGIQHMRFYELSRHLQRQVRS